jgi:hypothetical protein
LGGAMPQAGRTAAQRQSSNGARVFRVDVTARRAS